MGVADYSSTPGSNTAINGIGIEGTSTVLNFDNALRQLMADIAAGIVAGSFTANGYVSKAAGYTVVAGDRGKIIDCTAALTLSLTAAATLGAGFVFIVKANGGAVTVDPNSTENINGASTSLTVADGSSAIIACTGTAWHSITLLSSSSAASTTAAGVAELATDAEAIAKTDTARTLTPSNLAALGSSLTFAGLIEAATAAEFRANTAGVIALTPAQVWTSAEEVTLTDAATIAVDMSSFINAVVTLGGNRTLGNPTNEKVGQSGVIRIVQDGTGSRTLAYGTDWEFAGGTAPVLTTTAAAQDLLFYHVIASNRIFANLVKAVA